MVIKIKTERDMEEAVERMTPEQRTHLRVVIQTLVNCYLHDNTHGLLVVSEDGAPMVQVMAINADDMEAAQMLDSVDTFLNFRLLDEAPPKEMMN